MKPVQKINCICEKPPLNYQNYISSELGIDYTKGRYGEVTIEQCRYCNRKWVKYLVEYESFSRSGRWYKGIADEEELRNITPENTVEYIEKLDWYLYGGSYFSSTGAEGKGKVYVDL